MAEFLVELYVTQDVDDRTARRLADRALSAAVDMTRDGSPVRCLGSIVVPDDETCLQLFEAPSVDVVRDAVHRAGLHCEHISAATSTFTDQTAAPPTVLGPARPPDGSS
jgi:hypothetical protein